MGKELYTRWGRTLDPEHVLEEYPRPGLVRENCLILNGYWDYAITKKKEHPEEYEGRILVPFSPEAPLSGVNRQLQPDEFLHYARTVILPEKRDGYRYLLHFGAVDQGCEIYWNGKRAGGHVGGYLPFTLDVTEFAVGGKNLLQVLVWDLSDTSYHAKGKQSLERGGMWYTAQSGIWQTVWMETVPDHYISRLKLTPDYDHAGIRVKVLTNIPDRRVPATAKVTLRGEKVGQWKITANRSCDLELPGFESWSPESPTLYDIRIEMEQDIVSGYFGMRKYSMERDKNGILRFFLNNKPCYHNGLLDQGYFPDGLYTAPSDEALAYDIQTMKDLGFNMLRKHIKIEPERWYYHCDRIGMLVWQDMVCGGDRYRSWFVTTMPNIFMWTGRIFSDRLYGLFSRKNGEGRREFRKEMKGTVRHLYSHPCIAVWVPFNEGWGQFDAAKVSKELRAMDPSRLIDEASGWFDQKGGDMYSIHNYWRKLRVRAKKDRAVALTECGGYSYRDPEHSWCDEVYGYRKYTSREKLTSGIARLWEKELIPNIRRGLAASVYTQVSDIEDEVNGLLTYDRESIKVDAEKMRSENQALMQAYEYLQ